MSEPEPSPVLTLARKQLRRYDISLECAGQQTWLETSSPQKRVWIIIHGEDGAISFEEI